MVQKSLVYNKLHVWAQRYHNQALYKKYKMEVNGFHYKTKPTINHKAQLHILSP